MEVFDEASSKARQLEEQAGQQAEQGQFEAAILLYLAAAKVHPQDGKLFEQLSQCYTESEQYEEAYAAAAQAVQLAPEVNRCCSAAHTWGSAIGSNGAPGYAGCSGQMHC